ncbi:hypothetical protein E4U60_003854 [Claviceps pazoutovae]|uniref:Aminoglycoside phosphotransferase domain-containing protein n=1 Tax=Claviceps pazoutovae TaxID=1649127 RepID=A0A9P7M9Y5_9HYPO|nr:hypothetical protein E4U60_003854 [Claviceps pazoutovae]
MNPYMSDPDDIPPNDQYAVLPFYGRYFPRQDDFRVDLQYANSQSSDALQYWASVLERCDESVIVIAKSILKDVRVPEIYFAGKQARTILLQLHAFKPTDGRRTRSYVVHDPNVLSDGRILAQEGEILFSDANADPDCDMSFMHNDMNISNIIVDNDKITGLIDLEITGFFGWNTAGEVHRKMRSPQREYFVNANISEEKLQDILFLE